MKLPEEQQHVQFWIERAVERARDWLGDERFVQAQYALGVLGGLLLAFILFGFIRFLRYDPVRARYHSSKKDAKPKVSKRAPEKVPVEANGGRSDSDVDGADEAPSQQKRSEDVVPKRSRPVTIKTPTTCIKGFSRAYLAVSPNGRYVILTCRKSGRVHVHPTKYIKPTLGKELSKKGFFNLDEHLGTRPSVAGNAIGFSDCGYYCVIGESNTDTFYLFHCDEKTKHFSLQWTQKLPNRRLVTSFDRLAVDATGANIWGFYRKDCTVEVINRHQSSIGKERFKIGDAMDWTNGAGYVAAAGSYMTDIRLGRVHVRPDGSGVDMDRLFAVKSTKKIQVMKMTTPGAPENSSVAYLVFVDESGAGFVYDFTNAKADIGVEPVLVAEFKDEDYALHQDHPLNACKGIAVGFTGNAYHEVLHIALWNSCDVTVYRQEDKVLRRCEDFHDAHDGDAIDQVTFIDDCRGLLTVSSDGGINPVRLWTIGK